MITSSIRFPFKYFLFNRFPRFIQPTGCFQLVGDQRRGDELPLGGQRVHGGLNCRWVDGKEKLLIWLWKGTMAKMYVDLRVWWPRNQRWAAKSRKSCATSASVMFWKLLFLRWIYTVSVFRPLFSVFVRICVFIKKYVLFRPHFYPPKRFN